MPGSAKLAPPYSVVVVMNPNANTQIPQLAKGSIVAATPSCVAVGCRAEVDSETQFTLGVAGDVDPGDDPAFVGTIETPTKTLAVCTVEGRTILEMAVPTHLTEVSIWVNDATEPARVIIGIH